MKNLNHQVSSDPLARGRSESPNVAAAWLGGRHQPLVQKIGFGALSLVFFGIGVNLVLEASEELSLSNLILGSLGLSLAILGGMGLRKVLHTPVT